MTNTYQKNLLWRYATKQFDPQKKIPPELASSLLESLRLAPSSFGLQPWKFLVVTDPQLREKLHASAQQSQITEASHLVVLCARLQLDNAYVEKFVELNAKTRGVSAVSLTKFRDMLLNIIHGLTAEQLLEWNKRQVYLALGFLLSACAQHNVDACPMEGFDARDFDRILGLKERGLTATVLCAIGYRDPKDPAAAHQKVRFGTDEILEWRK